MLALPLLEGDSTIVLTTPLQSAPYVEMTQAVLGKFGVVVRTAAAGWVVPGRQKYVLPEELELEADYSQAAFWLAAKSLGHALEVEGLSVQSVQGDREIIPLLEEMGSWKPGEERRIDAAQIPDLVPILAVVALARPGVTILENAQRLRFKESDRLLSTAEMLGSMGAKIAATTDSLLIHGGEQLTGGEVDAHNDHRIAMAAAISALNSRNGATIMGADAVGKSYPGFFQELQRLEGMYVVSSWGTHLKMTIFGESHGPKIGAVVDGLPPGEKVDLAEIQAFLQRRAPGNFLGPQPGGKRIPLPLSLVCTGEGQRVRPSVFLWITLMPAHRTMPSRSGFPGPATLTTPVGFATKERMIPGGEAIFPAGSPHPFVL